MAVAKQNRERPISTSQKSAGRALASLSLATLLSSLGTSIASVGLPSLMQVFGAPFQAVQWVVLAYLLAITTLIVSAGRLADMFGRRPLLLGGIALFTSASVLCGLAPTLWLLIAARAVQGLGAALMMALTLAFVAETVSRERTGSAMGLLGAMSAIGTTLGPSLGGLLIAGLGWRAIFLVNVPLGLLTFALAWRALPAGNKAAQQGKFDATGTVLLGLTLAAYAMAMTLGRGNFGVLNVGLLAVTALGIVLFAVAQRSVKNPLVQLAGFRDLRLSASLAMGFIVATVMMATLVVGPFYLSRGLGLDAATVGVVLSTGPLVSTLSALLAGRLSDRLGAHRMMVAGLISLATGTALLSLAMTTLGIASYVGPITVTCFGYALFQTSNNAAVMSGVGAGERGVISGLLNLSRNLGLITGASLMGAIFAVASAGARQGTGQDVVNSASAARGMQVTFETATALALAALLLALLSLRISGRPQPGIA
ncbi:MFS transporter [Mesorhizobium sp. B2-4-17]|uniref:MFS transporter n=1 Tax=Mesorhizobium sp. B2-4-17 TaxID=2589932 RepID=UPI00112AFB64|nr:MFS transporter [Mesorhizobium sp. B2-4-17]TPK77507.1 MFS transporter [Mesorhizobium sp. B2-4-17]